MRFGNRGPRSSAAGRREAFRPRFQRLEDRPLLVAIDLGTAALPPALPNIATRPFGVVLGGLQSVGGAGFSVTDVGDVNGTGFDSFVIGAPTVINQNGRIQPMSGGNSRAYLIFGSQNVNVNTINSIADWLTRLPNPDQRVGDLGQLGNFTQQNPIDGASNPGPSFDGITFMTGNTPGSQLGVSVAAVGRLANGLSGFIIGAPGEPASDNTTPGTGRAYLIYGSRNFDNVPNKMIDLDNLALANLPSLGINIATFVNSPTAGGARTGYSVAGVGNVLGDVVPNGSFSGDVAIGAPSATVGGNVNTGAVYVIPGSLLASVQTQTISLQNVGQATVPGVIFTGVASSDQAGFSVAGAGDVDGAITSINQRIDDLLIGAPTANGGTGAAYLIYGGTNLPSLARPSNGVNVISLANVGGTGSTGVPGLTINGKTSGDQTGYAVASAGDFNGDGRDDILIGSPFANSNAGQALLLYGQPTGTRLSGVVNISTYPQASSSVVFNGAPNGLAGYSLASVGRLSSNGTTPTTNPEIAIGSPGLNSSNGGVYVIPSASALTGTFMLANAESQPVAATLVQLANPFTSSPAFLGASISGREPFLPYSTTTTADSDRIDDFIIGAPGYSITNGRALDGGAFIVQGAFFPLQVPVSTAITTQIGVGQAFSAPFAVNATTPANLDIFVFSNATISPPFNPVTDIDPATVVVNGVAFPNATIRTDPVDENKDGIPDAIITITPRSSLGLTTTTTTLTISGRTLATSPNNANKSWSGTAAIIVTGAPGPVPTPAPGPGLVLPIGTFVPTSFVPPFGPDHLVPPPSVLSRLDYKAIPLHVAQNQYLPTPGFGLRTFDYFHPGATHPRNGAATGFVFQKRPIKATLANSIYTPSKFPTGKTVAFTHEVRVIPTNRQREVYRPTPRPKEHPTNRP